MLSDPGVKGDLRSAAPEGGVAGRLRSDANTSPQRPQIRLHIAVLATLAVAFGIAGDRFLAEQRRVVDLELRRQLAEVADLKMNQIIAWRSERVGDAIVSRTDARLIPELQQVLSGKDSPAARQRVLAWTDAMRTSYSYASIILTSLDGKIRLSSGQLLGTPVQYVDLAKEAITANRVTFQEMAGAPPRGKAHFVLGAELQTDAGAPLGAMLLEIDPEAVLYPIILKWPTVSKTGEAFLARRSGNRFLYLSDLRRNAHAAMHLESSPGDANLVVNKAMSGPERVSAGLDPFGTPVLAAARPIPGSDWLVVAQIDQDEAYAPLRQTRTIVAIVVGLLVLLSGTGVLLIWRYQVSASYRQRYEAEKERRALLGRYDYLTRYANDAILLLDQAGLIIEANERATELFGYSIDELLRMNLRDLTAPETLADFERAWTAMQRQGSLVARSAHRRKDGSELFTEVSARFIEVDGETFCQSIIRDITERKQAEDQIRRLNRLYAVLSECGQALVREGTEDRLFAEVCGIAAQTGGFRLAAVGMVDPATQQIRIAARAGEAVDYIDNITLTMTDGPLGRGPSARCIRERRPIVTSDFRKEPTMAPWREDALRYGLLSSVALPLSRGGTEIGHLTMYSAEPDFFNEEEKSLAVEIADSVSHALDTMEQERLRQRAEEEVRTSRQRLELVLDASDEGYWDWNLLTGEAIQSPRYETMLGYEPGELATGYQGWRKLLHEEDLAYTEEAFRAFLASGTDTFTREYRMRCKSGSYIWVLSRGKIVTRDDGGKAVRMVGTNTDITERRTLQEQFLQAQKMESVGRLAGGVAHDFNNLLTVINGYSALLLARSGAQSQHAKQLEEILRAGERAADLTQQLLALSRKQKIDPQLVKINSAVTDSRKMLSRLIGEDIAFETALLAPRDEVMTDPGQIHQVLMNLVVNARDAMPNGGRLTVSTETVEVRPEDHPGNEDAATGPYLLLRVADTGTGMDRETQRHIFDPFFTTKEAGKGTGLGLSTVYGIVRQNGGFIKVSSELGSGTRFDVYLPLAGADALAPSGTATSVSTGGSETILLVEDQTNVRRLVADLLKSYGYSVIEAANADEALAIAETLAEPIHLLLTDVIMPGVNGKVLAERLKLLRPAAKVLYMSGFTDEKVGLTSVLAPSVTYLRKPFTPEMLAERVRQVLDVPVGCRTILVVDDQAGVRNLLQEFLVSAGHRALGAADGKEAMEILAREEAVDLVITDMFMPNQNGADVLRRMRSQYSGLRLIAMSGAFGGQFMETAESLGVTATLVKPIDKETFLQVVSQAFESVQ